MAKLVVTGGGGFIGGALCKELAREGHSVVTIARRSVPGLKNQNIEQVLGDLSANGDWHRCFEEADAVFHVAAKVSDSGRFEEFHRSNVVATSNVLDACRRHKVSKLVFTSTPSVVADGGPMELVDESRPYPKKHISYYGQTKAEAERLVIQANSKDLKTISLRPHFVWGPGQNHVLPVLVRKAQNGTLKQIGSGNNKIDPCFIEDCIRAHISAYRALNKSAKISGKCYFISSSQKVNFWDFLNKVLIRNDCKPVEKKVPQWLANSVALANEGVGKVVPKLSVSNVNRYSIATISQTRTFDGSAAQRDLGFVADFDPGEGIRLTYP